MIVLPPKKAAVYVTVFFLGLLVGVDSSPAALPWDAVPSTQSASGQFVVSDLSSLDTGSRRPPIPTNGTVLRLQAPWVAISAERFKSLLWHEMGLPANTVWSGRVFVTIQPADSPEAWATISPQPFLQTWNYRIELPDTIYSDCYARVLSAVLLLELANRFTPVGQTPADLPAWLVDGLAREIAESRESKAILSAPTKSVAGVAVVRSGPVSVVGGLPQSRVDEKQRGLDRLATARGVLQQAPALTFDQLSWPDEQQIRGADGGVYLASAQLFVDSLLNLKNGRMKIQNMLVRLPQCANWQSAFLQAFQEDFQDPLDVEKWWSLRVLAFAARVPGAQWSPETSRDNLDAVLRVPVEVRPSTNDLPVRQDISLQEAITTFDSVQRNEILRIRLRDLNLVQLRLSPAFAGLAASYRETLAAFLEEPSRWQPWRRMTKPGVANTIKTLDALDVRRRYAGKELEINEVSLPATEASRLTDRHTGI